MSMIGEKVEVYREVDWVAEDDAPSEREMHYKFEELPDPEAWLILSEILREASKNIWNIIARGEVNSDLVAEHGNLFIAASPPRPYNQWKYECAKSDIVVVGPLSKKRECLERLFEEKTKSLAEKRKAYDLIAPAVPALNKLVEEGLAEGVLGRGSYFDRNGFPGARKDDIDILILRKEKWSDEEKEKLIEILKEAPMSVNLVGHNENEIKRVEGSVSLSLIMGSIETVKSAAGIPYERYVLDTAVGIGLDNLPRNKSEALAKEFAQHLPAMVDRSKLPRLPPRNLLKSKG